MPKENRIYMRFDDDEMLRIEEKADGKPLASFCRDVVLGVRVKRVKKVTKYSHLPPEVARNLAAIGNNLNQIARLGYQAKSNNALETAKLLDAIQAVRDDLSHYLETNNDC